jgi:HEAT repeat protein
MLATLGVVLAMVSCGRNEESPGTPGPKYEVRWIYTRCEVRSPPTFRTTEQIPGDDAFHSRVAELATHDTVDEAAVGAGGSKTETYLSSEALRTHATLDQFVALAYHSSPVVRGYALTWIVRSFPAAIPRVAALLGDDSPLEQESGCSGMRATVSILFAVLLDRSPSEEARATLLAAASDERLCLARAHALRLLLERPERDPRLARIAEQILRKYEDDGEMTFTVLDALSTARVAPPVDLLEVYSLDPHPGLRQRAAQLLGYAPDPRAVSVLGHLLTDLESRVSGAARRSYARHPAHDWAVVQGLMGLAGGDEVAAALATSPSELDRDRAFDYWRAHPESTDAFAALYGQSPYLTEGTAASLTAFARKLATSIPLDDRGGRALRAAAICYLASVRDGVSLPEIVRSLRADPERAKGERDCAERGLAAIADPNTIPLIESILRSDTCGNRIAAAEALEKLGSKSSVALIRAAMSGNAYCDERLREIADQLEASP